MSGRDGQDTGGVRVNGIVVYAGREWRVMDLFTGPEGLMASLWRLPRTLAPEQGKSLCIPVDQLNARPRR